MLLLSNPHTYWLNVTNAGLGIAVCGVVLALLLTAIRDVLKKADKFKIVRVILSLF